MTTILIKDNRPISKPFKNGYFVDGKKPTLPEGVVELPYLDNPMPQLEANQTATSEWRVTGNGWERVWSVREKTGQEIAAEDWDCPEFSKRVTAPSELAEQLPSIVTYAQVNPYKMCIIPKGENARVYYNTLKDNHSEIINQLKLIEEERP